jgi:hypothetical protein
MACSRCWHIIGEHYLCRDHGGDEGFSAGALKLQSKAPSLPPPEAMHNLQHPWWNFLDEGEKVLEEAIP